VKYFMNEKNEETRAVTTGAQQVEVAVLAHVDVLGRWKRPVTTSIEPAATWYSAEEYHQDYGTTIGCLPPCPTRSSRSSAQERLETPYS
jgi:peptide methionine sulfoxide reductase MsrA